MPQEIPRYYKYIPKMCPKYPQDTPNLCRVNVKFMPNICIRYVQYMTKICLRYAQNICPRCVQNMPKICQIQSQGMPKLCQICLGLFLIYNAFGNLAFDNNNYTFKQTRCRRGYSTNTLNKNKNKQEVYYRSYSSTPCEHLYTQTVRVRELTF